MVQRYVLILMCRYIMYVYEGLESDAVRALPCTHELCSMNRVQVHWANELQARPQTVFTQTSKIDRHTKMFNLN